MSTGNPASTGQQLRDELQRLCATIESTGQAEVDGTLARKDWCFQKYAADGSAGATGTTNGPTTSVQIAVQSVQFTPDAALSFNASNYATLTLNAGSTAVASLSTSASSWTSGTPVTLAITASNAVVPATSQLSLVLTKAGTGVAVPAGLVQVWGYIQ